MKLSSPVHPQTHLGSSHLELPLFPTGPRPQAWLPALHLQGRRAQPSPHGDLLTLPCRPEAEQHPNSLGRGTNPLHSSTCEGGLGHLHLALMSG